MIDKHQEFERLWWGDCANTFSEQTKQLTYAHRMGLVNEPYDGHWPVYDLGGKNVLDIGGGPTSMLLKCIHRGDLCMVQDPCPYPSWVSVMYMRCGITYSMSAGETSPYPTDFFDECWIYNVLQHTEDPWAIIQRARAAASIIRIFEWLDIPPHPGHPSELKDYLLDQWLEGVGFIEDMDGENGCIGRAYYGVFRGLATQYAERRA